MYCYKCGNHLVEVRQLDILSSYGETLYSMDTGEKYTEESVYLQCPKHRWWSTHYKALKGVERVYGR